MIHFATTTRKPVAQERARRAADDARWLSLVPVLEARCPRGHLAARLLLPDVDAPVVERVALGEWGTRGFRCRCRLVLLDPDVMVPFLVGALRKRGRNGLPRVKLGAEQVREPVPEELELFMGLVLEPAAGQGSPFDVAKMDAARRARDGEATVEDERRAQRRRRAVEDRSREPGRS